MPFAVLPAQSRELLIASDILFAKFLVVVFQLVVIGKNLLRGWTFHRRLAGFRYGRFSTEYGTLLDGFEFPAQARDHALKPFDIVPSLFLFVYRCAILDVPRAIRVLERIDCFGRIPLDRTNTSNHESVSISTEGIL